MASNTVEILVRWSDGLVFEGLAHGRAPVTVDGDSRATLSPIELLLVAAASCSAADVVTILAKQRVVLRSLEVAAQGTRREAPPRRFTAMHFRFAIAGDGADEVKARRAIDLSLEKYCSVVATLAPDTRVTYDVALA
jgi:putative redox protein